MKTYSLSAVTALLASNAVAFPTLKDQQWTPWMEAPAEKRLLGLGSAPPQGAGALPLTPPPFDANSQKVSTTGDHAFVAPGSGDQRGQCPGLNALANHGYLPHNGVATIQQFIDATYQGFGMAQDLSGFLAVYGAIVDGDGSSWSIGGVPHTGILGSHHNYEADSSPLKSDLNQYGSNTRLIMSQWQTLYNMQSGADANYNLPVMRDFRSKRYDESIQKNPYFFYGPFDGQQVSQAAFTFIYRFMSNKSAEAPEGILSRETLRSFMSISGPDDSPVWTPGHERFPDTFYKRNDLDQYSIPYFEADIVYFASKYPKILNIGCNQGKVNTYRTISPTSLTSGAATVQSLLQSPLCFGIRFLEASGQSLLGLSDSQTSQLKQALSTASTSAKCSGAFTTTSLTQLKNCPGFSFYGGPTGPVAPGAIQS